MVHALEESRRILFTGGTLINVQPLTRPLPLEIILPEGCELAGLVEMDPKDLEADLAAFRAVNQVIQNGIFKEMATQYFDATCYWNNIPEMKDFITGKWGITIREDILQNAYALVNKHPNYRRVRVSMPIKMDVLEAL